MKIDVRAEYLKHADGLDNPVRHNTKCSEALEQARLKTGLSLVNCMAQGTVNIQNTRYSAVTRCSIDYKLGDEAMAKIPHPPVLRQYPLAGTDRVAGP